MSERSFDYSFSEDKTSFTVKKKRAQEDRLYLLDLVKVLGPYPAGLRRWSVMRRIRKNRDLVGLPIPQKMEDAVERVFRNHCADSEYFKKLDRAPEKALFYWPEGRVGVVWAVYPDRAESWLKTEGDRISI